MRCCLNRVPEAGAELIGFTQICRRFFTGGISNTTWNHWLY
ncbi:hypothetical protein RUMCAL_01308 [Ruminococcus callidus ATCC 27760]|uniref:Uncharacterized protein n=1 Tax=Ruminococcus callidus ATCC 27760 TaxID=411473 RepID=U2KVL1_9FIRM|nr:hypothetical protein RUMCAL_01308 [Ruminococcus callidus ATCC 27760]